jgi:hypothetical protein
VREQQDALYAAEREVHNGPVFPDVAAVQRWLDDLRETWWWEEWIGERVLRVEAGIGNPGKTAAGVGAYYPDRLSGRLEFKPGAELNERRCVHELAHVIASAVCHSKSHDPWFARVYLELTYLIRGPIAYQELQRSFDRYGIDHDARGMARESIAV